MAKQRLYDVEVSVVGAAREKPKHFNFEIPATSFGDAVKRAEQAAIEKYYDDGGQGDDPQIESLKIDDETVN